ncbi:hypothetical protein Pen02_23220 [Plantactinospora endophytica]|uniref:Uncharacterized protein n=1 Tax=Plantactinospora endophytica TaxID=673535 RepID=A0ABQ4DY67_9ACTN|nr:hypothetical protein Pen02_23220 [Plantactinospora endophytica]
MQYAPGGENGAERGDGTAPVPAGGPLAEQQHGDRGRGDRIGQRDGGQRSAQPGTPVGDLGQQQPGRGHPDHRHGQADGGEQRAALADEPGDDLG